MKTLVTFAVAVIAMGLSAEPKHPRHIAYRSFQRQFEETGAFAKMGVNLRAFGVCNTENMLGLPYSDYASIWKGEDKYDFAPLDQMVEELIKASPDAEFLCLVDLNSPRWLARRMRLDSFDAITHAACDERWRSATRKYAKIVVDYIEKRWGSRIRAYLLMAGQTTEWFENDCQITSEAKDAAFVAWCKKRGVKTTSDRMPTRRELAHGSFEGVIFDPATEAEKIAAWHFHSYVTADALLDYAKVVRGIVGDKKEIGSFFGYYFICNKGLGSQGHLDYERVISSPYVDFFSSPATYTDRGCGFGTGSMAVAGTLRRYGKRVLHEIDFWPDTKIAPWTSWQYWATPAETVAGNTREMAFALVNGTSWWWFDMYGGFYENQDVRARISRFVELNQRFGDDLPAVAADILVVADPDSACAMADPDAKCPDGFIPSRGCGEQLRNVVNGIGVIYDTCSFNDLAVRDLKGVKLVCLPATWTITPEKKKVLEEKVCRDGRTVLWTYAPGVSDGKTLDVARIREWAGVPFKTKEITTTAMKGWKSVYAYDWRKLTKKVVREMAEKAGCFCYTDDSLPVTGNGRLLAIHCKDGGNRTIHLPRRVAKVVDLLAKRDVAADCDHFDFTFKSPDTALFELVK